MPYIYAAFVVALFTSILTLGKELKDAKKNNERPILAIFIFLALMASAIVSCYTGINGISAEKSKNESDSNRHLTIVNALTVAKDGAEKKHSEVLAALSQQKLAYDSTTKKIVNANEKSNKADVTVEFQHTFVKSLEHNDSILFNIPVGNNGPAPAVDVSTIIYAMIRKNGKLLWIGSSYPTKTAPANITVDHMISNSGPEGLFLYEHIKPSDLLIFVHQMTWKNPPVGIKMPLTTYLEWQVGDTRPAYVSKPWLIKEIKAIGRQNGARF